MAKLSLSLEECLETLNGEVLPLPTTLEDCLNVLDLLNAPDEHVPLAPITSDSFTSMFATINSYVTNLDQDLQVRVREIISLSNQVQHPENIDPHSFGLYTTSLLALLGNEINGNRADNYEIEAILTRLNNGLRELILNEEMITPSYVGVVVTENSYNFSILANLFEQKLVPEIDYVGELGLNFGDITQMTEPLIQ